MLPPWNLKRYIPVKVPRKVIIFTSKTFSTINLNLIKVKFLKALNLLEAVFRVPERPNNKNLKKR